MFNAWNDRKQPLHIHKVYSFEHTLTQHAKIVKIAKILELVKMIGRKISIFEEKQEGGHLEEGKRKQKEGRKKPTLATKDPLTPP
jgi:hypothetical protein